MILIIFERLNIYNIFLNSKFYIIIFYYNYIKILN